MKKWIAVLMVVILLMTAVSCSSSQEGNRVADLMVASSGSRGSSGPPEAPSISIPSDYDSPPPITVASAPPSPEIVLEIPPAALALGGGKSVTQPTATMPASTTAPAPPSVSSSASRMIVRTGIIQVVVEDVQSAIDYITGLANTMNGYVVSSKSWQVGAALRGSISIRVPAEQYENVLKTVRDYAVDVKGENTSTSDVTEQYIDLQAKLTNLEATEAQLLRILEKAVTVEEILKVQTQLSSTRSDIERTKGSIRYIEQTAATSLLQVDLEQSKLFASIVVSQSVVQAQQAVFFSADISGGFPPYSYQWGLGDGTKSTKSWLYHAYSRAGDYTIKLVVTDDKGNEATETREKYINVITGWNAGNTTRSAWNGLTLFWQVLLNILIWLGIFSPVWIIGGGITWFFLRRSKRRKAQKPEIPAETK